MNNSKILPTEWEIPQHFRARFGEEAGQQRLMVEEGHLLLVLHEPPAPGVNERQAKIFWRSPEGVWKVADATDDGLKALQQHLHKYVYVVERLEKQLASAQRAEDFFNILRTAAPTLRAIRHMYHIFQDARNKFRDVRELIIFRDQTYELERTTELLDAEAKHALDFTIAQHSEEEAQHSREIAESSYRLNLLASLFLPTMALAGLLSMNFPETLSNFDSPLTFLTVLGVGIGLGYYLTGRMVQKK